MSKQDQEYTTIHIRRDLKELLKKSGKDDKRSAQAQLEYILEDLLEASTVEIIDLTRS